MPRVSEKKESRHTKVTQVTKTRLERHTTTIKTTTSGKPASGPKPSPRGIVGFVATKNSKPSTPIKHRTTHETTRKPSQNGSTKIVPARMMELQTMAMRPVKDGRTEWKLKVKGPTPGETIVERGIAIRSGDKITTGLFREENLNSGHNSSGRKNAGSSNKLSAGHFFAF
ncbi:hypothetical protein L211DRAFT_847233 [Terfezia boudieri ATCC MYA-4762]|uniref:Uncharacterized protein n=1 Tax=Terfezia boudieri ATCC MYA-4762 TaxID=1051890 RepID=A0A3N4MAA5_9PEZI|nr:hypothetical protein L211DRAFT_847233 [Terfezia boudieri ATCC MYA-4762]